MVSMSNAVQQPSSTESPDAPEQYWQHLLAAALGFGCLLAFGDDDWPIAIAIGVIAAAGIAVGRERRVLVACATAALAVLLAVVFGEDLAMFPLLGYACFYLAYKEPLRTTIPVSAGIALTLALVVPLVDRERLEPLALAGVISFVVIPVLFGVVLQQQRQQVQARVAAATAAHTEQVRLAIARDLHDIVAHGLTAVAIQSGTAIHLFDSRPDQAKEALANVNEASRSALTELRAMVGELRSANESKPVASADPIAAAIERISPAILVTTAGDELPAATPSTVRVAIERVVGEALANVIAHGGSGPTTVSLKAVTGHLRLSIDNEQGPSPAVEGSTGFGIIGMTERVAAVGGTLVAEPRPDGFTVTASIPRGDW